MSKSINDGGPAFPVLGYTRIATGDLVPIPTMQVGMSLRAWFAGMALQGCCVNGEPEDVKHNAIVAVRNADALIAELERKP